MTWKTLGEGAEELAYIVGLLEDCIYTIQDGRPERAAWRLADAGGRLRHVLETLRATAGTSEPLIGLTEQSGLGCQLPVIPETPRGLDTGEIPVIPSRPW